MTGHLLWPLLYGLECCALAALAVRWRLLRKRRLEMEALLARLEEVRTNRGHPKKSGGDPAASGKNRLEENVFLAWRRDENERHRLLALGVQDCALCFLRMDGSILTWNDGARRLHGFEEAEALGRHFSLLHPPPEKETEKPEAELLIARHDGRYEEEGWRVHKDGSRLRVQVTLSKIMGSDGRAAGLAYMARKAGGGRAAPWRETLREEKAAREFMQNGILMLAHQLRNPLAVMMLSPYLDEVEKWKLQPREEEKEIARLRLVTSKMKKIVEDIQLLGRWQTGKFPVAPAPVHLSDFCRVLLEEAAATYDPGRRITCRHHGPEEAFEGDERCLRHLLDNLLANALKYSPPGAPARLETWCGPEETVIEVHDEGSGIPREDLEKIFTPFYRAANAVRKEGLGLGLAIARQIARRHGGEVTVRGAPGRGSVFTVRLPSRHS